MRRLPYWYQQIGTGDRLRSDKELAWAAKAVKSLLGLDDYQRADYRTLRVYSLACLIHATTSQSGNLSPMYAEYKAAARFLGRTNSIKRGERGGVRYRSELSPRESPLS